MSVASIESAATWVGNLVVQEVKLLAQVSGKVDALWKEMEWVQCALRDADRKQSKDLAVKKWISDIKDLAHESEDVIELYILQVSHKRPNPRHRGGIFTPYWIDLKWLLCLNCADCTVLHELGGQIDDLLRRIKDLNSRRETYNGIEKSNDNQSSHGDQRRTFGHVDDEGVVGLKKHVRDVAGKLGKGGLPNIVVIHGMGGIGKTTLARKVYRHPSLKSRFDSFAWVYVSQKLQLKSLCRDILLQLIPEKNKKERKTIGELKDSEQLIPKLHQVLEKGRCVVVIDDIWYKEDWKLLQPALPLKTGSSKIIVTTRNPQIVPQPSGGTIDYYEAQLLKSEQSWELFQNRSNFNKEMAEPCMVDLGGKMLRHCSGHPLAIVVLGGILETKKTCEEWQDIHDNFPSHIQGNDLVSGVSGVLEMSYYDLPYQLKACFLHLGYFPEDFLIPVERIYHLWIAEGIVSMTQQGQTGGNRSVEDIAKFYLSELVQKGLVQISLMNYGGEHIQLCKLHDMMREMCLKIAKEDNFLHLADEHDQQQPSSSNARELNDRLRRLAIYVDQNTTPISVLDSSSFKNMRSLRSLLFFAKNEVEKQSLQCIEKVSKNFPLLRILDLTKYPGVGPVPQSLGELIFLRYLSICDTRVTELPSEIGNLRSLLILDLRVSEVVIRLPNVLWRLKSLTHIYFPSRNYSIDCSANQGYEIENGEELKLGNLRNLETIVDVDLDGVDVQGLLELTSLQRLAASCVGKIESLVPFLRSSSIKTLKLRIKAQVLIDHPTILSNCSFLLWLHIDDKKCRIPVLYLPIRPGMIPNNLVELAFWYCQISEDSIYFLGELPRLKSFQLHICYLGEKLHFSSKLFPEVTHLIIDGLWYLRNWTVERGSLPKLKKLEVYFTPIQMLPDVLSQEVLVQCQPCVNGIERFGTCSLQRDNEEKVEYEEQADSDS